MRRRFPIGRRYSSLGRWPVRMLRSRHADFREGSSVR